MNKIVIAIPPTIVSVCMIIGGVLYMFWDAQANKIYILQLAFPILCIVALLFLLSFIRLGEIQLDSDTKSLSRVFLSATQFSGLIAVLIFIVFVLMPDAPVGAVGTKPSVIEIGRGIFLSVFLPIWSSYILGGVVQLMYLRKYG